MTLYDLNKFVNYVKIYLHKKFLCHNILKNKNKIKKWLK